MRNYWLKIVLGALVIFAAGMVIAKGINKGSAAVHEIADGAGPISIPLPGFVPFSLDGTRLGSVRRITMYRSAPKLPSSFAVSVQLADSVPSERLARCIIMLDTTDKQSGGSFNVNANTAFRCLTPADTAGRNLVAFGTIKLRSRPDSFAVLVPRQVIADLQREAQGTAGDSVPADLGDSIQAAVKRSLDSATARAH
jgi:hypothetical protein